MKLHFLFFFFLLHIIIIFFLLFFFWTMYSYIQPGHNLNYMKYSVAETNHQYRGNSFIHSELSLWRGHKGVLTREWLTTEDGSFMIELIDCSRILRLLVMDSKSCLFSWLDVGGGEYDDASMASSSSFSHFSSLSRRSCSISHDSRLKGSNSSSVSMCCDRCLHDSIFNMPTDDDTYNSHSKFF